MAGATCAALRFAVPGGGPYTASKAAVESLIRPMSKELAPRPTDTDLLRASKNRTR